MPLTAGGVSVATTPCTGDCQPTVVTRFCRIEYVPEKHAYWTSPPPWAAPALRAEQGTPGAATNGRLIKSSVCGEIRTDQQDVVVGVYGGHHPR
jgi:hypothetical protein